MHLIFQDLPSRILVMVRLLLAQRHLLTVKPDRRHAMLHPATVERLHDYGSVLCPTESVIPVVNSQCVAYALRISMLQASQVALPSLPIAFSALFPDIITACSVPMKTSENHVFDVRHLVGAGQLCERISLTLLGLV